VLLSAILDRMACLPAYGCSFVKESIQFLTMEDTFYRLACRIKSNGRIARSADYHDLKTVQSQVTALNAERGETCEYFVESVKLNALLPWEVMSLADQNLISLEQLERYSSRNDDHRYINNIRELIQRGRSQVKLA